MRLFKREEAFEERESLSLDDIRLMKLMQENVRKVNGHYEIPLPFRDKKQKLTTLERLIHKLILLLEN